MDNNIFGMPSPPQMPYNQNQQQYYGNSGYAVDAYGNKVQADVVYQPSLDTNPIGVSFSGLMSGNGSLPMVTEQDTSMVVTTNKKKPRKKKDEPVSSAEIVNNTVYADTYEETNSMLKVAAMQMDALAGELTNEFNTIRNSRTLKGKYTYMANIASAIASTVSVKIGAVREMNSSIKAANDAEYKRFKDNMAAASQQDDNKYIMDMYKAYVSTPVGTLPDSQIYQIPDGAPPVRMIDASIGIGSMVRVGDNSQQDVGFNNYMANLTPEQNAMLMENNPNVKEVIVYDQQTGKKYFDWRDMTTGKSVPNMPIKDPMFIEDFTIDPKTRTARNLNLAMTLPVIYENEKTFNNY